MSLAKSDTRTMGVTLYCNSLFLGGEPIDYDNVSEDEDQDPTRLHRILMDVILGLQMQDRANAEQRIVKEQTLYTRT